nr:hypothetical protein [Tanacetum cinerariifolium]
GRIRSLRLIHRLKIGNYLLLLDLGVRSKRVLLCCKTARTHYGSWSRLQLCDTKRRMMAALKLVNLRVSYQAADDFAVQHIMRTQALEAGARDDTLEDTGSSS